MEEEDKEVVNSEEAAADELSTAEVDFVLVWSAKETSCMTEKSLIRRKTFERNLVEEGLILNKSLVRSGSLTLVKIQAPYEVLERYAEILRIHFPLKEIQGLTNTEILTDVPATDKSRKFFKNLFSTKTAFPESDGNEITYAFHRDKKYLFDVNESNYRKFFPAALRSRIVHFILKRKSYSDHEDDQQSFGYERLIRSKTYLAAYPLHDGAYSNEQSTRGLLLKYWGGFQNAFKYQPLDAIKDYFGAKVAIYFAWLGFYTSMLIFPAIFGIMCFIYGLVTVGHDHFTSDICTSNIVMCPLCDRLCDYWHLNDRCGHSKFTYLFDNDATAAFSLVMSLWTAVYLEFWKRYSNELNYKWNLTNFDSKVQAPRPEYLSKLQNSGKKKYNYITNSIEPAVPFWRMRLPFTILSISSMLILISIAVAAVVGVVAYRLVTLLALSQEGNRLPKIHSYELMIVNITAACLNLFFILTFSRVYRRLARELTELELPRTQQEYEWSFAFKLYILQFINYYSSIFYIAYIKGNFIGTPAKYSKIFGKYRQEECGISCMPELCIQLAVIMVGKQGRNAVFEMLIPLIRNLYAKRRVKLGTSTQENDSQDTNSNEQSRILQDYRLLHLKNDHLTEEYLEMVIQYGFVTIFVAAFPLAPLFALLNNILEIRIDAQKLLKYYRRPIALRVKGIGVWYTIMNFLSRFAVLSNAIIIAITSTFVPKFVFRYFYRDPSDPHYGSLHGFLETSLCTYHTSDLESPPSDNVTRGNQNTCSFPTYRHSYNHQDTEAKYGFTNFHWKVWLARVVFVVAFQNVVALFVTLTRWIIPDISGSLKEKIQREEFLTSELIIHQELLKSRGVKENSPKNEKLTVLDLSKLENDDSHETIETSNVDYENTDTKFPGERE